MSDSATTLFIFFGALGLLIAVSVAGSRFGGFWWIAIPAAGAYVKGWTGFFLGLALAALVGGIVRLVEKSRKKGGAS